MKQQCRLIFIYGSWAILLGGLAFYVLRGEYLQAAGWVFFIVLFLWLYVRYFSLFAPLMGYGTVDDRQPRQISLVQSKVTLYTGIGCPFCPIVKRRLKDLQTTMGFELREVDVTFRPELLMSKGIRALPVVELGETRWVGNATSEELAAFITNGKVPGSES